MPTASRSLIARDRGSGGRDADRKARRSTSRLPRSGLAAYLAVLRIAFGDLHLSFQRPTLILRFSYEHK